MDVTVQAVVHDRTGVAEEFLAEQMVHAYEKLYREVLEERASR